MAPMKKPALAPALPRAARRPTRDRTVVDVDDTWGRRH
jgi:hypothetical protein